MSGGTTVTATGFERVDLPLSEVFTISRGSTETATNVLARVTDGAGRVGIGGAAPVSYVGETVEGVETAMPDLLAGVEEVGDPHAQQRIEGMLADAAPDRPAARTAVSIAVHDLAARQTGEALYRRWGLDPAAVPATSYTVGIDTPAEMAARARRIRDSGYQILKIKLGTDDDRRRLEAVREAAPDARIRVDANGAWTPEGAVERCEWLADAGVEFVEQPVAHDDIEGLSRVGAASPIPVAADESCLTATDVPAVAEAVDIVVVKLMKCGGLRPAVRQIATAQAHGLDVMLGCMVESYASLAAAWHLAPLVEYADLDGALLLAEDPFEWVSLSQGRPDIRHVTAGTGVT
ncbi:MAG: dipeptide epimerase [Halovenus sp.]